MKKILLFVIIFSCGAFAQLQYVEAGNPVYNFLDRMESQHIITGYSSFEIPKSREEIAGYLKQVIKDTAAIDDIDKDILHDLEIEFEYELYGTLKEAQKIIGDGSYNIFSQKAKYLYYYDSPGRASLFINILGEGEEIFGNNRVSGANISTGLGSLGGIIRGTFADKFGFFIKGTNGAVFGDRNAALYRKDCIQL